MECSNEFYIEDLSISLYVFKKYFSKNIDLKDDLINSSLMVLWKARQQFDENKGSKGFLFICSRRAMLGFLRKEQQLTNNYSNFSINKCLDDDVELIDILVGDDNKQIDDNFDYECLREILVDIFRTNKKINKKGETFKKIINLFFLEDVPTPIIVKTLKVSRQYVGQVVKTVREIIVNEFSKRGIYEYQIRRYKNGTTKN